MKDDRYIAGTELRSAVNMSPKLRAALDYLGDKLVTHRASRFRPTTNSVLDEWLAGRRAIKASLTQSAGTRRVVRGGGIHTIPEFLRKGLRARDPRDPAMAYSMSGSDPAPRPTSYAGRLASGPV